MNGQQFIGMIQSISRTLNEEKTRLNNLDSMLGDGDHGTGISTGFADAADKVSGMENTTPAAVLRIAALSLMNRMGGSSGALYGTLFMKGSLAVKDKPTLQPEDVVALWQAGLIGVKERGKAQLGDKTMIDALEPAVNALATSVKKGQPLAEAFAEAAIAAQQGAEATIGMVAKHGRAKFVGERSRGQIDAGAVSISLMFSAINDYLKGQS